MARTKKAKKNNKKSNNPLIDAIKSVNYLYEEVEKSINEKDVTNLRVLATEQIRAISNADDRNKYLKAADAIIKYAEQNGISIKEPFDPSVGERLVRNKKIFSIDDVSVVMTKAVSNFCDERMDDLIYVFSHVKIN